MTGKDSTQPVNKAVLAAMMDDLGIHRIEELVEDDDHTAHHRLATSTNTSSSTRSAQPQNKHKESRFKMWHDAIEGGHFDDDDAAGVRGLNTFDNGNAHRLNATSLPSGQLSNRSQVRDGMRTSSQRPTYDPSQPTYKRGGSRRAHSNTSHLSRIRDYLGISNGNPRVSSLGGIIPDGGEVRRWDTGRSINATHPVNNPLLHRSAGRGRPTNLQNGSPSGPPTLNPGFGHGRSESIPNPLQKIDPQTLEAMTPPNNATSWQLPHLRKTSESPLAASQIPTSSQQASPRLSETTVEAITLGGNNDGRKLTTLDAREIFVQAEFHMPNQKGADDKPASGRMVIYEPLHTPIGIWEITIGGKKVMRGDIREVLEILGDGSKVFLRRYPNKSRVLSEPLRFSDVTKAKDFMNESNIRRAQYLQSSEPIYPESTFELAAVQDEATSEDVRPELEPRSLTPAPPLTTAEVESTPAKEKTGHIPKKSRGSDSDLISWSPEPTGRSPKSNEQEPFTIREAETPTVISSEQQVYLQQQARCLVMNEEHEPHHKKTRIEVAEEVTKALRDINILDGVSVPKDRSGSSLQFPWLNSTGYETIVRKSRLLTIALGGSSGSTSNAAFVASLLQLVEMDEFLNLPRDEQKKCLATLYAMVRGNEPRIIRTQKEIYALRSSAGACPEAIKDFNVLIRNGSRGGPGQRILTPRPPTYSYEIIAEKAKANNAFLDDFDIGDSLSRQAPRDATTTNSSSTSADPTPGQPSKLLNEGTRGLAKSRWAEVEVEDITQQSIIRGEKIQAYYPPALLSFDDAGDKTECIIDRKANSHRRSLTNDSISILTDQLKSLSVNWEGSL
ncbi:hypothetical protein GGS24DRAFT_496185 [Hypoxylon argillaceum]|nr:hypothetical protein GGS24DRAFT_496185 [Hypoxylon argillaceum]